MSLLCYFLGSYAYRTALSAPSSRFAWTCEHVLGRWLQPAYVVSILPRGHLDLHSSSLFWFIQCGITRSYELTMPSNWQALHTPHRNWEGVSPPAHSFMRFTTLGREPQSAVPTQHQIIQVVIPQWCGGRIAYAASSSFINAGIRLVWWLVAAGSGCALPLHPVPSGFVITLNVVHGPSLATIQDLWQFSVTGRVVLFCWV